MSPLGNSFVFIWLDVRGICLPDTAYMIDKAIYPNTGREASQMQTHMSKHFNVCTHTHSEICSLMQATTIRYFYFYYEITSGHKVWRCFVPCCFSLCVHCSSRAFILKQLVRNTNAHANTQPRPCVPVCAPLCPVCVCLLTMHHPLCEVTVRGRESTVVLLPSLGLTG